MSKISNDIVSVIAYALGVSTYFIIDRYGITQLYEMSTSSSNFHSLELVRSSCIVRQYLLSSSKSINNSRYKELLYKNDPKSELFKSLKLLFENDSDLNTVKYHTQYEYMDQFNELNTNIEVNLDIFIDNVILGQAQYNINKDYIIDLFDMSKIQTFQDAVDFCENVLSTNLINKFPFRKIINEDNISEIDFNILHNDKVFLDYLYSKNNSEYDESNIHNSPAIDEDNGYTAFMTKSCVVGVDFIVDCENVDYTKVVSYFHSLTTDELKTVTTINLIDNTEPGIHSVWDNLTKEVNVKVIHTKIGRIIENKSCVDFKVYIKAVQILNVTNHNIVLLASDSDYWSLITTAPERFMVGYESEKIAGSYIKLLTDKGINKFNIINKCKDLKNVVTEMVTRRVVSYLNNLNIDIDTLVLNALKEYFVTNYANKEPVYRDSIVNSLHLTVNNGMLRFNADKNSVSSQIG
jgi:hypothetical protein